MTARDEDIRYVEGVWTRGYELELGELEPAPHAWFTVFGHLVDLTGEFYGWGSDGDDADWVYEPLRDYPFQQLDELFGDDITPEGFDISSHLWHEAADREPLFPEAIKLDNEPQLNEDADADWDAFWEARGAFELAIVFKPAIKRMMARKKAMRAKKVAA